MVMPMENNERLRELAYAYASLKKDHPWQFFKPLPKQAEVQRLVGEKFQVVLFQGGNWTGKTITGANLVAQIANRGGVKIPGYLPQLKDYGLYNVDLKYTYCPACGEHYLFSNPNEDGVEFCTKCGFLKICEVPNMGRIATEKELVEKDVLKNLKKQLGDNNGGKKYMTEKKMRPFESQWLLANGSEFDVMTYDQDPKQFEGVELNWVWMNEPSTEAIFKAMLGRFKQGGVLFITATILGCAWILDEIIESSNPRYRYVRMDIDENRKSKGGYLADSAIEDMLASMDIEQREARKTGNALKLLGLVFKQYDRAKHFIDLPEDAPKDAMVIMASDPHDKIPMYSAWAYKNEAGQICIYKEHPQENFWEFTDNPWANEDDLVHTYMQVEDVAPVRRLLDAKFGNTKKFGQQLTVKEILNEAGLSYEMWDGKSTAAHNKKIRSLFTQDMIVVSQKCPNMDRALRRHRFLDQTSGRAKDEKGQREDVDAKYRHPIDTLAAIVEAFDDGIMDAEVVDYERTAGRDAYIDEDEEEDYLIRQKGAEKACGRKVMMEREVEEADVFMLG